MRLLLIVAAFVVALAVGSVTGTPSDDGDNVEKKACTCEMMCCEGMMEEGEGEVGEEMESMCCAESEGEKMKMKMKCCKKCDDPAEDNRVNDEENPNLR
jgi:hypothetical protein